MSSVPTGTVTFLFTDIEGSTRLARAHPAEWESARQRHHVILRAAAEAHQGYVFQIIGDAFCVAFPTASDALAASLEGQRALQSTFNNRESTMIRVRMGLHTGAAEARGGDYRGYLTLAHVQRVMSTAYGGQTLVSNTTASLLSGQLPNGVTLRDLGEHRLKGLLNPERPWQMAAPDLEQDFPPLQSLNTIPNNLPIQVTSFVGRERELSEVQRLLSTTRLLTLTGSGGTGKTRLSLQVAAEVLDNFKNGIWLVELAPLADAALVPQTVASVLGVREEPGRPLLATLMEWLQPKQLLLMLDNCEHLIDACARLADAVLHAGHETQILASSREALGIAGETAYRVPSLECPNAAQASRDSAKQLTQYAAVQLFIDRATQSLTTFAVTNTNASAVAQICYRLDGIPLAIELAAARIKVFSAEQIAARLDDRFRLLTGGSRIALPRQQTLRALIDWSHSLLSESERILFLRLAVFAGGWNFEAAEAICADDVGADGRPPLPTTDILDLLSHLVEKSLVTAEQESGEARYRMLETVRQYARDKMLDSGEGTRFRDRHLEFYLRLAEEAHPHWRATWGLSWIKRFDIEHDNLRAAIQWSLDSNSRIAMLRLPAMLWYYWYIRGYYSEGLEQLKAAVARPAEPDSPIPIQLERANALNSLAVMQTNQGYFIEARRSAEEALAISLKLNDRVIAADAYRNLGHAALRQGNGAEAQNWLERSLVISRELKDEVIVNRTSMFLGDAALFAGDYEKAERLFTESAAFMRASGGKNNLAFAVRRLGYIAAYRAQLAAATAFFNESLTLNMEIGEKQGATACLVALSIVSAGQNDPVRAIRLLAAANASLKTIHTLLQPTDEREYERMLAAVRRQVDEQTFEAAWREGYTLNLEQAAAYALGSVHSFPQ